MMRHRIDHPHQAMTTRTRFPTAFHCWPVALGAGLLALCSLAQAAPTPISTQAKVSAQVQHWQDSPSGQSNEWVPADPLAAFSMTARGFADDLRHPGYSGDGTMSMSSRFDGASAGVVDVALAWTIHPWFSTEVQLDMNSWDYTFRTDGAGRLTVDRSAWYDADNLGTKPLYSSYWLRGPGGGFMYVSSADGSFAFDLAADTTYTFSIRAAIYDRSISDRDERAWGRFTWSIQDLAPPPSAVPAPGTPSLLALAAVLAWRSRRGRRQTA